MLFRSEEMKELAYDRDRLARDLEELEGLVKAADEGGSADGQERVLAL